MASYLDGHCLLINPLLGEVLSLPTDTIPQLTKYGSGPNGHHSLYGMGFDDKTNTYKIVQVFVSGYFEKPAAILL